MGLDVCVFFFLALLPGLLSVAPRPLMILSEHPGPDVVFYQEDGALGSPKGSCAEEEGSLVERVGSVSDTRVRPTIPISQRTELFTPVIGEEDVSYSPTHKQLACSH